MTDDSVTADLNRFIHERVMGYHVHDWKKTRARRLYNTYVVWKCVRCKQEGGWHPGEVPLITVPRYTTSAADSADVKKVLRAARIPFRIEPWHLDGDEGAKQVGVFYLDPEKRGSSSHWLSTCVKAETEELAIALFAKALVDCKVLK